MFHTLDDARSVLTDWLENCERDSGEIAEVLEQLLPSLNPVIGFEPASSARQGGTRFGGVPDLPAGTDWPIRPVPDNLEEWVGYGGPTHEPHIRRYLSQSFPFEFFAQVDLTETAALSGLDNPLPKTGRLLFFYERSAGPWQDGTAVCRVIHDETAAADLSPTAEPAAFAEMIAVERAELTAEDDDSSFTVEERLEFLPRFVHPAQPMTPQRMLQILPPYSPEFQANTALKTLIEAGDDETESLDACGYSDLDWEHRTDHLKHQMLGAPLPEQDDPRYSGPALTPEGKRVYADAGDDYAAIQTFLDRYVSDWHLLLQVDLAHLLKQDYTEGTVYFVIHDDALKARRFDEVIGVYQQT